MGMSDGKLVPRHLAGWITGPKTMQDDDTIRGGPASGSLLITEDGDSIITEGGDNLVTE